MPQDGKDTPWERILITEKDLRWQNEIEQGVKQKKNTAGVKGEKIQFQVNEMRKGREDLTL